MARYYQTGGFRTTQRHDEEDVNPLETLANMTDAMLVFACGLLLALIVAWNVDLGHVEQVEIDETQEIENIDMLEEELAGGNAYVERGIVYQDPSTGKMYLLEDGEKTDEGEAEASQE